MDQGLKEYKKINIVVDIMGYILYYVLTYITKEKVNESRI